jgi:dTDP-4-amino-4,6-dideoxygalactose transaminase
MINFAYPKSEYLDKKKEIDVAIGKTLKSNDYILGKSVKKFERNFSHYNRCKYSIGVSSGTEAIIICLKSLGIKIGDEVITTSHTAYATVAAITEIGAKPVLIDIENTSFNMNHEEISKNLTKKTRCLILVHLYGIVANVKRIEEICKKNRIFLIEDCSQAHGAEFNRKKVGTFGDFGTFSFYPTKNLSTFGDAGAIITNNQKLYLKAKLYREYGWKKKNIGILKSINRRMDEIHAAILNVKIKYLNNYNKKREKIAQLYSNEIKNKNIILPKTIPGTINVFHLYVIIIKKNLRNKLIKYLQKNNINPGIHYKLANHQQIPFKNFKKSKLINTKKIVPNILSLPIYPALSLVNVKKIIKLINLFD